MHDNATVQAIEAVLLMSNKVLIKLVLDFSWTD